MEVVHSHHMDNHNIISRQAINSTAMINSIIIIRVSTINMDIRNSLVAVKIKDGINIRPWDAETVINIIKNHCIRMCWDQEAELSMEEGWGSVWRGGQVSGGGAPYGGGRAPYGGG